MLNLSDYFSILKKILNKISKNALDNLKYGGNAIYEYLIMFMNFLHCP